MAYFDWASGACPQPFESMLELSPCLDHAVFSLAMEAFPGFEGQPPEAWSQYLRAVAVDFDAKTSLAQALQRALTAQSSACRALRWD